MKTICILFVCALWLGSQAQAQQFISDINGRPVFETKYTDVEGSPYLTANWSVGTVKTPAGKTYEIAKVRFDAYKCELEYEEAQKLYRFSTEIMEFGCGDGTFRRGFPAIENLNDKQFYQILYDGKTKLLKRILMRLVTERAYNSATETKRFIREESFYIFKDNHIKRFKKDKKSLLEILDDKQNLVEEYLKVQKLKLNRDEDLIKIIEHYDIN
jgi:hypothetical protein